MSEKIIGIYKITSPSGKIYIGKSVDVLKRKNDYNTIKCKYQPRLYNSIVKYGWINHIFEVIEECSVEYLSERERFWQDEFDVIGENGLNCLLTLTSDKSGRLHEDTLKRMSEAKKGEKNKNSKKVICTKTGKEYYSAKNCAESNNININTLICKLIGKNINNTSYIYLKDLHLKNTRANQDFKTLIGENNTMFGKKGKLAPNSKAVFCTVTNKKWDSIKECADENGIKKDKLGTWLNGLFTNPTTFKFI